MIQQQRVPNKSQHSQFSLSRDDQSHSVIQPHLILSTAHVLEIRRLHQLKLSEDQIAYQLRRSVAEVRRVIDEYAAYQKADRQLAQNPALTSLEKDLIRRFHREGMDYVAISRSLSLTKALVLDYLTTIGHTVTGKEVVSPRYVDDDERAKILADHENGVPIKELARKYNRHRKTIRSIVRLPEIVLEAEYA